MRIGNTGIKHYNWNGGKYVDKHGYIMVYSGDEKLRNKHQGYVEEHRQVMENHLGRKLKKSECIIHINGNIQDNRIENLKLVTRSEQISLACKKDMSNRFCQICGSYTTYKRGDRVHVSDNTPCYVWYHTDSDGNIGGIKDESKIIGYACYWCYQKSRRKSSKNQYKWRTTKAANSHGGGSY